MGHFPLGPGTFAGGERGHAAVRPGSHCLDLEGTDPGPQYAVDGNPTTRWSSAFADGEQIAIDVEAEYQLPCVVLVWETASAANCAARVSSDATWTTASSNETADGGIEDLTFNDHGRYMRLLCIQRATPGGRYRSSRCTPATDDED